LEFETDQTEKSIDWLRNSRAKYLTVSRPSQAGDRVEIDFEGECDGKKIIVVAHGHLLILLDRLLQNLPIKEVMRRYRAGSAIENASVSVYEGKIKNGRKQLILSPSHEEHFIPWKGLI